MLKLPILKMPMLWALDPIGGKFGKIQGFHHVKFRLILKKLDERFLSGFVFQLMGGGYF